MLQITLLYPLPYCLYLMLHVTLLCLVPYSISSGYSKSLKASAKREFDNDDNDHDEANIFLKYFHTHAVYNMCMNVHQYI